MLSLASFTALVLAVAVNPELGPEPAPIGVPEALLTRTTMPEPSGIVWSPTLQRYLIVSDDTGDKASGTNHAPWLFAMSRDGVFDSTPIPILGLEKLNDAEALCQGPSGTFFLATSHAKNRHGKAKAERRHLFWLQPSGRALKVLGSADLATAITSAGLVPEGALDLEALAFRDGALYLGLKAPQSTTGSALILRIPSIVAALTPNATAPTPLTPQRWAEVPLQVSGVAGPVVQGISDLSFLPDGSLALLANSPKHQPPDGGGALWWLVPGKPPTLLRRFPGLKPEGVTLAEDGKSLLIVFDHDREQPLWLRLPLPTQDPPKALPSAPKPSSPSKAAATR